MEEVFRFPVIRTNIKALEFLHIHNTIQAVSKARLQKDAFDAPLLCLSDQERTKIGELIIYCSRFLPEYLSSILTELLKTLQLPDSVCTNLITNKSAIRLPYHLDQLEPSYKWDIIWSMIAEAMRFGCVDSRYHVAIQECAYQLGLNYHELLELEGNCADFLQKKLTEIEHNDEAFGKSRHRKKKLIVGGVIGGGVLLVTGLIATPLFIPVFLSGTAFVAGILPASLGLSSAILMGGSLLAVAMAPTLPLGLYDLLN